MGWRINHPVFAPWSRRDRREFCGAAAKHCHQLQISSQSRHHDDGVFEDFVMLMIYDDIHDFHDYCRGVERVWDGLNKMVFSHPHERKFYPKGTILSLVTNITSGARHMCEILPPLKND